MASRSQIGLIFAILASGCAHARPAGIPTGAVVWPQPPAAPRVRLVAMLPSGTADAPSRSFWRRALTVLTGTEEEGAVAPALLRPFGVALAADGSLFVTDPDARTVQRASGGRFEPIVCAARPWSSPSGIALGADGSVFVADVDAVVRVAPGGACTPLAIGAFDRATGVAVAGDRILVTDPPRHVVRLFDADGAPTGTLGPTVDGGSPLHFPSDVSTAPDGTLLVVDTLNFAIARFSAAGSFLGRIGVAPEGSEVIVRPKGAAGDAGGRVYMSDAEQDVVAVFAPDGRPDYTIGATGSGPGQFRNPAGISVSGARLAVADSLNGRVQVFEIIGGAP